MAKHCTSCVQKTSSACSCSCSRLETSVTKSHVHHPWNERDDSTCSRSLYSSRSCKPATWAFSGDVLRHHFRMTVFFCFSVFDCKYHKRTPLYMFLLHPHYFLIYESEKKNKKKERKQKKHFATGGMRTIKNEKPISAPWIFFVSLVFQTQIGNIYKGPKKK